MDVNNLIDQNEFLQKSKYPVEDEREPKLPFSLIGASPFGMTFLENKSVTNNISSKLNNAKKSKASRKLHKSLWKTVSYYKEKNNLLPVSAGMKNLKNSVCGYYKRKSKKKKTNKQTVKSSNQNINENEREGPQKNNNKIENLNNCNMKRSKKKTKNISENSVISTDSFVIKKNVKKKKKRASKSFNSHLIKEAKIHNCIKKTTKTNIDTEKRNSKSSPEEEEDNELFFFDIAGNTSNSCAESPFKQSALNNVPIEDTFQTQDVIKVEKGNLGDNIVTKRKSSKKKKFINSRGRRNEEGIDFDSSLVSETDLDKKLEHEIKNDNLFSEKKKEKRNRTHQKEENSNVDNCSEFSLNSNLLDNLKDLKNDSNGTKHTSKSEVGEKKGAKSKKTPQKQDTDIPSKNKKKEKHTQRNILIDIRDSDCEVTSFRDSSPKQRKQKESKIYHVENVTEIESKLEDGTSFDIAIRSIRKHKEKTANIDLINANESGVSCQNKNSQLLRNIRQSDCEIVSDNDLSMTKKKKKKHPHTETNRTNWENVLDKKHEIQLDNLLKSLDHSNKPKQVFSNIKTESDSSLRKQNCKLIGNISDSDFENWNRRDRYLFNKKKMKRIPLDHETNETCKPKEGCDRLSGSSHFVDNFVGNLNKGKRKGDRIVTEELLENANNSNCESVCTNDSSISKKKRKRKRMENNSLNNVSIESTHLLESSTENLNKYRAESIDAGVIKTGETCDGWNKQNTELSNVKDSDCELLNFSDSSSKKKKKIHNKTESIEISTVTTQKRKDRCSKIVSLSNSIENLNNSSDNNSKNMAKQDCNVLEIITGSESEAVNNSDSPLFENKKKNRTENNSADIDMGNALSKCINFINSSIEKLKIKNKNSGSRMVEVGDVSDSSLFKKGKKKRYDTESVEINAESTSENKRESSKHTIFLIESENLSETKNISSRKEKHKFSKIASLSSSFENLNESKNSNLKDSEKQGCDGLEIITSGESKAVLNSVYPLFEKKKKKKKNQLEGDSADVNIANTNSESEAVLNSDYPLFEKKKKKKNHLEGHSDDVNVEKTSLESINFTDGSIKKLDSFKGENGDHKTVEADDSSLFKKKKRQRENDLVEMNTDSEVKRKREDFGNTILLSDSENLNEYKEVSSASKSNKASRLQKLNTDLLVDTKDSDNLMSISDSSSFKSSKKKKKKRKQYGSDIISETIKNTSLEDYETLLDGVYFVGSSPESLSVNPSKTRNNLDNQTHELLDDVKAEKVSTSDYSFPKRKIKKLKTEEETDTFEGKKNINDTTSLKKSSKKKNQNEVLVDIRDSECELTYFSDINSKKNKKKNRTTDAEIRIDKLNKEMTDSSCDDNLLKTEKLEVLIDNSSSNYCTENLDSDVNKRHGVLLNGNSDLTIRSVNDCKNDTNVKRNSYFYQVYTCSSSEGYKSDSSEIISRAKKCKRKEHHKELNKDNCDQYSSPSVELDSSKTPVKEDLKMENSKDINGYERSKNSGEYRKERQSIPDKLDREVVEASQLDGVRKTTNGESNYRKKGNTSGTVSKKKVKSEQDKKSAQKGKTTYFEDCKTDSMVKSDEEDSDTLDTSLPLVHCSEDDIEADIQQLAHIDIVLPFAVPPLHCILTRSTLPSNAHVKEIKKQNIQVKSGTFSKEEDKKILANWKEFCEEYDLRMIPSMFISLPRKMPITQKTNLLRYLARGLDNRFLHRVHARLKTLLQKHCKTTGRFTAKEDEIILQYMRETPSIHPYRDLSELINRSKLSIEKRYYRLISENKNTINWTLNLVDEFVRHLKKITKCEDVEELQNRKITSKEWRKLSKKMNNIPVLKLQRAWKITIYPRLFTDSDVDLKQIKEEIIEILHERKETDWRMVNWKEISEHFQGFTPSKIYMMFKYLVNFHVPKEKQRDLKECIDYLRNKLVKFGIVPTPHKFQRFVYKDGHIAYEEDY